MVASDNPGGVPHFFHCSMVSSELFDFVVKCCLSENSATIAKHIKHVCSIWLELLPVCANMSVEFHLLEYHWSKLEYLQFYEAWSKQVAFMKRPVMGSHLPCPQKRARGLHKSTPDMLHLVQPTNPDLSQGRHLDTTIIWCAMSRSCSVQIPSRWE